MIKDAQQKQFEYIIVYKLDRFSRNRIDSAMHKHELRKYGVKVISATERISNDPEGIILEGMLESLAEYYSANLSKHVKRGLRESAIKGTYVGGVVPTGYKVVDRKLVVDEEKAPIVKYAFEQYAAGIPKKVIVDELNAKGYTTTLGKPFSLNSFYKMLINQKYIGKYIFDGMEVTGGCPALVDEDTFNAVQDMLKKRKHAPAAGSGRVIYHLQGKASCGKCGTRLVSDGGTGRGGVKHHYYACGKRKKYLTCNKVTEKKDFLEYYIVEQTVEYVLSPHRIKYIAAEVVASYQKEFNTERIKGLEKQVKKLSHEISKVVDASIQASAQRRPHFFERLDQLETQKLDIEIDLSRLKIAMGLNFNEKEVTAWLKTFCNGDPAEEDFRKRIINTFINSVFVYDDKIVIYYNLKGGKQVSYIEMLESTADPPTGITEDAAVQISTSAHHQNSPLSCRNSRATDRTDKLHFQPRSSYHSF